MKKILAIIFLVIILPVLLLDGIYQPAAEIKWGANFSISQAVYVAGDEWRQLYLSLLDELKPQRLRLMAYWPVIEPARGKFDFSQIDYLLAQAGSRNIEVILVLGRKQPRWPECHHPEWFEGLEQEEQGEAVTQMLEASVTHFKKFANIKAWQIENEPFFVFGENCPAVKKDLFKRELALVKRLDPDRPIVVTDSGEKGTWLPAAWAGADIFGSTMYRTVYHDRRQKYITYPIPPALYRIRTSLLRLLSKTDQIIGVELQAEPWFTTDVYQTPLAEQVRLMNKAVFWQNIEYARAVGFEENYLWGAEWWYWARQQGQPELWEEAKRLFQNPGAV